MTKKFIDEWLKQVTLEPYDEYRHGSLKGIYLIRIQNLLYVGQTGENFKSRFASHRREFLKASKNWKSMKESGKTNMYTKCFEYYSRSHKDPDWLIKRTKYFILESHGVAIFEQLNWSEHHYIKLLKTQIYGLNQLSIVAHEKHHLRRKATNWDEKAQKYWEKDKQEFRAWQREVVQELEQKDKKLLKLLLRTNERSAERVIGEIEGHKAFWFILLIVLVVAVVCCIILALTLKK
ncbi:hypothetical protein ACWXVL_02580 [Mycoplasma sp. 128]